jgi:hypothetical protein
MVFNIQFDKLIVHELSIDSVFFSICHTIKKSDIFSVSASNLEKGTNETL